MTNRLEQRMTNLETALKPERRTETIFWDYTTETAEEAEKRLLDSLPPERRENVDVVLVRFAMEGEVVADAF